MRIEASDYILFLHINHIYSLEKANSNSINKKINSLQNFFFTVWKKLETNIPEGNMANDKPLNASLLIIPAAKEIIVREINMKNFLRTIMVFLSIPFRV